MDALPDDEAAGALGVFDEESCRYFLRELGFNIVSRFPFEFGIEEVYTLILETYGFDGLPDAVGLLEELLEDDQCSKGYGDDGDIWRSWRLAWRRRYSDPSSPFIAKVAHFVLPPPTPREVRQRKASNFLQLQAVQSRLRRSTSAEVDLDNAQNQTVAKVAQPEQVASVEASIQSSGARPESYTTVQAVGSRPQHDESGKYEGDSMQGFKTVTTTVRAGDLDPDLLVSIEMLNPGTPEQQATPHADQDGGTAIRTLVVLNPDIPEQQATPHDDQDGERAIGNLEQTGGSPPTTYARPSRVSSTSGRSGIVDRTGRELQGISEVDVDDLGIDRATIRHSYDTAEENSDLLVSQFLRRRSQIPRTNIAPWEATLGSLDTIIRMRRAAHRQARLIDGELFNSGSQVIESRTEYHDTVEDEKIHSKRPSVTVPQTRDHSTVKDEKIDSKRSSWRLSWQQAWPKQTLRSSWVKNIRTRLFCHSTTNKQGKFNNTLTSPAEHVGCTNFLSRPSLALSGGESMPTAQPFGLDGAFDASPSSSPSKLNKPLPQSPEQIVRTLSTRRRDTSSNSAHSIIETRPSTASTAPPEVSQLSQREYFRSITQQILEGYRPVPEHHSLQPLAVTEMSPYYHECEPARMPPTPRSPVSYSSVANNNPFTDTPVVVTPSRAPPTAWRTPDPFDDQPPNLPTANTHAQNVARTAFSSSSPSSSQLRLPHRPVPLDLTQISNGKTSSTRGRSRSIPEPNTNSDQKIHAKEPAAPHRSRSPIKRLFGLGKSGSSKEVGVESQIHADTTPESHKKSSLNKWSHKLRHGFLNNDQEQLAEEAKVEEHIAASMSTGPPQQSTFPITIDPPHQARIHADIELMLCVTANRFLMHEAKHGHISAESVVQIRKRWETLNRAQVLEFMYDGLTQYELVMANIRTVHVHGPVTRDAMLLSSTLYGWKTLAREMSVRTFCDSDSTIRKHLHDAHRVLELLSAPTVTMLAFQDVQLRTLSLISDKQRERLAKEGNSYAATSSKGGRDFSSGSQPSYTVSKDGGVHRRNVSEGSVRMHQVGIAEQAFAPEPIQPRRARTPAGGSLGHSRKATGAAGALMK